jgi:hypothetical protein
LADSYQPMGEIVLSLCLGYFFISQWENCSFIFCAFVSAKWGFPFDFLIYLFDAKIGGPCFIPFLEWLVLMKHIYLWISQSEERYWSYLCSFWFHLASFYDIGFI